MPLRIKEQLSLNFAQENNKLKDSGSCTKMTSTCNCPIGDEIISATRKLQIVKSYCLIHRYCYILLGIEIYEMNHILNCRH